VCALLSEHDNRRRTGESVNGALLQAALRVWALEEKKGQSKAALKPTPLSVSSAAAFWHQQNATLVSRIYRPAGNGTLPIPGGKFELGKRGRQFGDN
jgi:hypothetical protein